MMAVHIGIGRVVELAGNKDLRVVFSHFVRNSLTFRDTIANIACIMYQNYFRAIVLHQFAALLGNRIRHDDLDGVALDRAAQREADALIAACGFDNDRIRTNQAAALRVRYHIQSGARFDGAADVQALKLDEYLRAVRRNHAVQAHHRRVADRFQNIAAYHRKIFLSNMSIKHYSTIFCIRIERIDQIVSIHPSFFGVYAERR